jgi:hypothetical protein
MPYQYAEGTFLENRGSEHDAWPLNSEMRFFMDYTFAQKLVLFRLFLDRNYLSIFNVSFSSAIVLGAG